MNTQKSHNLFLLLLILISVFLSISYRFIQDDAFISFIYSKNFIRGEGLTWFGNYVEGYSDFLWVLWIALGLLFQMNPIMWSQISGIFFFMFTIYLIWLISKNIFTEITPTYLTIIFIITNYTMVCYATGGLETMMQTFFIVLLMYLFYKYRSNEYKGKSVYCFISLISSFALLTRLDSAIPVTVIFVFIFIDFAKSKNKLSHYILLILPLFFIVGIWFCWKLFYYGSIFPNSFNVKIYNDTFIKISGIKYIYRFFQWYLIWPFFLIGLFSHIFIKKFDKKLIPVVLIIILWILYIYYTGGDFMEFRFFVPILPFIFLIVSYSIFNFIEIASRISRIILVLFLSAVLILSSFLHSINFKGLTEDNYLDSIHVLGNFYGCYLDGKWDLIGATLKKEFQNVDVTLAVAPVGAIVYYSEIKTIDMLGLNEKFLYGNYKLKEKGYERPGHKLIVKMEYLEKKGVNFIIGHPNILPKGTLSNPEIEEKLIFWLENTFREKSFSFSELTFIGIPITDENILVIPYLTKTPVLDKLISEKKYEIKTVFIK